MAALEFPTSEPYSKRLHVRQADVYRSIDGSVWFRCCHRDGRGRCADRRTLPFRAVNDQGWVGIEHYCKQHYRREPGRQLYVEAQ